MKFEYRTLFLILISWQVLILIFFAFGLKQLPLQPNFLGGSIHFQENPLLWAHGNYDGEHYLSIAQFGYSPFQYFFFPLYPVFIRFVANYITFLHFPLVWSGILISLVSFFIAFLVLYKLLRVDYSIVIARRTILLLLLFPASFYFTAVYTESLFLALCVSSLYFARKHNWVAAGILGIFATLTRVTGLVLFLSIFYEWLIEFRASRATPRSLIPVLIIPTGLLFYMYYLYHSSQDPLAFFHNISLYGDQRSERFIMLPQVFYRYIFEILPNVGGYLPIALSSYLEFASGILFFLVAVLSFIKVRTSYTIFLVLGYLIPTFTGSFSSMPRYVVVLFPAFLTLSLVLDLWSKKAQFLVYSLFGILLALFTSMFVVGYWVS